MTPAGGPPALAFSLLGYPLRLAEPGALRLLLAVAVLALLGAISLVRRRRVLARAAGALAPRVAPAANLTRPAARLGLSLLGLALLAVALSRPQCGSRVETVRQEGVDLAVVLDASRSMLAADVRPDRLSRARLELGALLDGLGDDRVGLVVFAGDAAVACPLTSDRAALKMFLRAVEPDAMPRQGTALAPALAAARGILLASRSGARAQAVLVVSDGEDHEGGVASVAQALARDGIRLFALAVGTEEGAPVPPRAGGARPRGAPPVTRLDLATLRLVADAGGGDVYDAASPGGGLSAFREALGRMARSGPEWRTVVAWEERYAFAAFPGFLLLLAALLVREARGAGTASGRARDEALGARGIATLAALFLAGASPFLAEEENVRAGNERLLAGDPAGARRAYDAAERAAGRRPEIDFDRGSAAMREGRLDDAAAAFRRASESARGPLASRALQNLGNALAAAGDREGAVRAFSGALARDPSNEDARWDLEVLLRQGGGREDAGDDERRKPESSAAAPSTSAAPAAAPPGERSRAARDEGGRGNPGDASAAARGVAADGPRREPLTRQEAEALLDALRASERRMPFFGSDQARARRDDAAPDW